MRIRFKSDVPVEQTMEFEQDFAEGLALALDGKREVLSNAIARWMFVDGLLIGETYGHFAHDIDEEIPGVMDAKGNLDPLWDPDRTFYVYTTGIHRGYRRAGLATILKSHLLGVVYGMGVRTVIGHSRANGSLQLNEKFGAVVLSEHPDWYGTAETYWMYRIDL